MERTRKIMNKIKRKLLHNRNISFKGYIRDDELFEIEAELIDTKNYDFQNHDRGTIKKDEPIHQMKIKLVLDDNLFVVDAEAKTENSPYFICKNANSNFKKLLGYKLNLAGKRNNKINRWNKWLYSYNRAAIFSCHSCFPNNISLQIKTKKSK